MDLVLGMGEVGSTMYRLLQSRGFEAAGIDSVESRCTGEPPSEPEILHVCIPYVNGFDKTVLDCAGSGTGAIMVHSTVRPGTAKSLQKQTDIPIISSPARGVHSRFLHDMTRYTKFVSTDVEIPQGIRDGVERRFHKVKWMSNTKVLELAKLLTDTTYYGWLIVYAQITKMICDKEGVDYDEMWTFADEIHKVLGNRPKMYPGIIGGHCVIPNLALMDYEQVGAVGEINEIYRHYVNDSDSA